MNKDILAAGLTVLALLAALVIVGRESYKDELREANYYCSHLESSEYFDPAKFGKVDCDTVQTEYSELFEGTGG